MGALDRAQKTYFTDPRRFADLWNGFVYQGKQMISWKELQEVNAVQTGGSVERTADLIMKRTREGETLAVLILENQREMDYSMPARVFLEEALAYDRQVKEIRARNRALDEEMKRSGASGSYLYHFGKEDRLRPVSTLVLHWNCEGWDGARSLRELIDFRGVEEMRGLVPEYPLRLIDVSKTEDDERFRTDLRFLIGLFHRRSDMGAFRKYVEWEEESDNRLDESGMAVLGELLHAEKLQVCAKSAIKEGRKVYMSNVIDELIEDGRKEERAQTLWEAARADAEKTRADAEKTRADAEKTRADAAEAEVKRLKALLAIHSV